MRRLATLAAVLLLAGVLVAWIGWREARADPIVRRASVTLPRWPAGAPPVTLVLMSDIHVESASMDEARLARIVAQVNALRPDLVVIAGDFVQGHGNAEARRAAPILERTLSRLRAPLGIVAVLGNHDHWTDPAEVATTLRRIGVVVLSNEATTAGPLAIGGLDDPFTHRDRIASTTAMLRRLRGAGVMVAHSPDAAPQLPRDVALLLAGHTHCGQVVLPIVGPPIEVAAPRYRCGIVREGGRTTIVTAGLGTSDVPIRWNAPPDLWLIRLGPRPRP